MLQSGPKAIAEQAQRFAGKETHMRGELKEVVKEFLSQFKDLRTEDLSIGDETNEILTSLACFVAGARTGVIYETQYPVCGKASSRLIVRWEEFRD